MSKKDFEALVHFILFCKCDTRPRGWIKVPAWLATHLCFCMPSRELKRSVKFCKFWPIFSFKILLLAEKRVLGSPLDSLAIISHEVEIRRSEKNRKFWPKELNVKPSASQPSWSNLRLLKVDSKANRMIGIDLSGKSTLRDPPGACFD